MTYHHGQLLPVNRANIKTFLDGQVRCQLEAIVSFIIGGQARQLCRVAQMRHPC